MEIQTFETPFGKQKVEIKSYITGREKRALTDAYFSTKIEVNAETKQVKGLDMSLINKAEEIAWKIVIVSIDGKKAPEIDIVETILNMRAEDYSFITKKVNEATSDKSFEEKKTI